MHSQLRKRTSRLLILGYGVMVTLQILVLSFLVRVRVSQLHYSSIFLKSKIGIWCNGNTTDSGPVIPGSSPGIPTHTVRHLSVMKGVFFVYRNSVLWSIHNNKPQSFRPGVYCIYFFSASIALIFCFTISRSALSFSILRFISSTRLLPFLLAVLKKPRLFS